MRSVAATPRSLPFRAKERVPEKGNYSCVKRMIVIVVVLEKLMMMMMMTIEIFIMVTVIIRTKGGEEIKKKV